MFALTTPEQIALYRLLTLRQALKLEALGMTGRKSANVAACQALGLPKGTHRARTLEALNQVIAQRKEAMTHV